MRKFRCLVRGDNIWIRRDSASNRFGFYTTRFVAAANSAEAEAKAIADVLQELRAKHVLVNDPADPPSLVVEEIDALSNDGDIEIPRPGFTFFDDSPQRST